MSELIDKWEVVSKLITLQNNYNFFKNEWDVERLYREIAKLEINIGKTPGLEVVRCKDCIFMGMCSIREAMVCTVADGFCWRGERKDNG